MGAGCSNDKAAATEQSPPILRTKSGVPTKDDDSPSSSPPVPVVVVAQKPLSTTAVHPEDDWDDSVHDREPRNHEDRVEALQRCFQALDKDKSGTIDSRELKQYLFKTGVNVSHITGKAEELMKKMDLNEDELISLDEFVHMMEALLADKSDEDLEVWVAEVVFTASSRNVVGFGNSLGEVLSNLEFSEEQVEKLREVFKVLDRDQSGFVELHELKMLLGQSGVDMDHASDELVAIMTKLDKNGDNKVSTQEFFVTLSAIRKSLRSDPQFMDLLENVLAVTGGSGNKTALTEVLLAEDL